jgi:histidinol-phosphate aminotransferase
MIERLAERDVFMRMPGVEPLNRCVRVGVGNEEEFEIFADAFKQAL